MRLLLLKDTPVKTMPNKIRTYSELMQLSTYGDRLNYLSLDGQEHESPRFMSNPFYKSRSWINVRKHVITRDLGCDLAIHGMYIDGRIIIHHMNPLVESDLEEWTPDMFDPEFLVCVSEDTHNKIHYGKKEISIERAPGDTKLW